MDAGPLNAILLTAVLAAVFFYILYGIIRAATRDGIIEARRQAEKDEAVRAGSNTPRVLETVEYEK